MENSIEELIKDVLGKGYLMSLATMDEGGLWVADVIFVHGESFNIYWMSHPDTRHSKAILKDNQIAGSITVNGKGEDNLGIQFSGLAWKLEGPRHDLAVKHFAKRNKPEPKETDDVLQGRSWYVLKPTKIDLIYEKLFGFKKQTYNLS